MIRSIRYRGFGTLLVIGVVALVGVLGFRYYYQVMAATNGLIASYSFDDQSLPYSDYSGNNLHATCNSATNCPIHTATGGYAGSGGVDFSGVGKYLTIPNEAMFDFKTAMTVSFWMKNNVFDNPYETLVAKGASAWGVTRNNTSQSIRYFTVVGGQTLSTSPSNNVADNAWHNVAVSFDGSSKKVYIDGVLAANDPISGSINVNNSAVTIGYNTVFTSYDYTGFIDDLRIYNRALSEAEIIEDMNNRVGGGQSQTPPPVSSTPIPTPSATPLITPTPVPSVTPTSTGQSTYPVQAGKQIAYTSTLAGGRQYLLFLPNNYNNPPEGGWPIIMFVHGTGIVNRPPGADPVRLEPLPGMLDSRPNFQYIVVSPRIYSQDLGSEGYQGWLKDASRDSLYTLLNEIQANYTVNSNKTYLTGYSMGGAATWNLALTYPSEFAAVAPVAGYYKHHRTVITPSDICDVFGKGVRVYHGTNDASVNIAGAQNLVNSINNCGDPDSAEGVYSNWTHDSIRQAVYSANDNLYNWMSLQSLP